MPSVAVPSVAVVVLTMADRPQQLVRALASVARQRLVATRVVVVVNGAPDVDPLPSGDALGCPVDIVHSSENLGIPEGRNVGLRLVSEEFVAFLDDDAELVGDDVLARSVQLMTEDGRLAAVAWRLVDEHGGTARRHVPRLGGRSALRSGEVTYFLGGAVLFRTAAVRAAGGYFGPLFYSMEETELAWRMLDRDARIWYDAESVVFHPSSSPARHPDHVARTARNRVWIAHRCLPAPLGVAYVTTWIVLSSLRSRQPAVVLRATRQAWSSRPGPRCPIRWRTAWRLTRLGRPPVV